MHEPWYSRCYVDQHHAGNLFVYHDDRFRRFNGAASILCSSERQHALVRTQSVHYRWRQLDELLLLQQIINLLRCRFAGNVND